MLEPRERSGSTPRRTRETWAKRMAACGQVNEPEVRAWLFTWEGSELWQGGSNVPLFKQIPS